MPEYGFERPGLHTDGMHWSGATQLGIPEADLGMIHIIVCDACRGICIDRKAPGRETGKITHAR